MINFVLIHEGTKKGQLEFHLFARMQAAGWSLLTLPQGWMDLCLLCEGQALAGGGTVESTATPWFFMHVGRLDSICDRKTKTMLIIIIQAFHCHRGGGKGQEKN